MPIIKVVNRKSYYADYTDAFGKRHRFSLGTDNKKAAELKFAEVLRRENLIRQTGVPNMSWDTFKAKYFAFLKVERADNTQLRHQLAVSHLEKVFMPKFIADITPAVLQNVKERMVLDGVGAHNVNRLMQALKAMMRKAEDWELVAPRKWQTVGKIKTPRGRVVFHTTEEIKKLLAACTSLDWELVILLGCRAGLRRGEIANLRWQDVNFKDNQLYVAPDKTDKYRYVPIAADLLKALQEAQKCAKNEFVINIGLPSSRHTKDYLTSLYPKICKRAGVKSFLHELRHTFASHLVQEGVDLYRVSKLMGHSSIEMTEIYAHLAPQTLQDAIKQLPKI